MKDNPGDFVVYSPPIQTISALNGRHLLATPADERINLLDRVM